MIAEGVKAYNPQTGETAIFTNGKWAIQGSAQMPMRDTDQDALKGLQSDAQQAQWLDQKAQQFMQTQGRGAKAFATGPAYHEFGIPHIAENLNPLPAMVGSRDPRMGELESLSNQAWVHLRPTGSGALRAPEIAGFQQAFPNVTHWGNENAGIVDRLHQDSQIAAQKLAFIDNFIRSGRGTYADANQAWVQGGGMGGGPTQPGAASPAPQGASPPMPPPQGAPDGQGAPTPQQVQAANLPPGAVPAFQQPPPPQAPPQVLNWTPERGLHQ